MHKFNGISYPTGNKFTAEVMPQDKSSLKVLSLNQNTTKLMSQDIHSLKKISLAKLGHNKGYFDPIIFSLNEQ